MTVKIPKKTIFFIIGLALVIGIFYFIGIDKLINNLVQTNLFLYSIGILSVSMTIFFWCLRWKCFIKFSGYEIKTKKLLENLMIGMAINNLTPVAKMGGEPVRAYLLKKDIKMPVEVGLATILADLTIEFLVCLFFVIFSIILATFFIELPVWLSLVLIIFLLLSMVVLGGILGVCSDRNFITKIIRWIVRKIKKIRPFEKKAIMIYRNFQNTFKKSFRNKKLLFKATFFGIIMRLFDVIKYVFIFMALGYQINLITTFIAIGIGIILMSIPSTPGSLGIAEVGMISTFTLLGVPIHISTAGVFLERLIWFWGTSIVGTLIGIRKGVKLDMENKLKGYKNLTPN